MRKLLVLALCLFGTIAMDLPAEAQRKSTRSSRTKKSSSELRNDLSAIRDRKNQIRRELAKARKATKVVQTDIYVIDASLERLEGQLSETTKDLSQSRREQTKLEDQLDAATKKVALVKEQVRRRLRYMYVHKGESVLSAFIGVKSVGDIASRKALMTAVAKKDRQLFNEYRELQSLIKDRKARQDRVVSHIRALRNRQIDQQAHLEVVKDDKRDALRTLRNRQDQLEGLLAQLQSDEASVYAQIRAYEAAKRRRPRKPGEAPLPSFSGRFARPTRGPITSRYGMRFHPILKRNRIHAGIDFGGGAGSPIYAAAAGEVIAAQYSRSYGNMVIIDHGGGITTLYAHASRLYVRSGQSVKRGQVIAAIGSTGLSTAPHLHWEVRVNGNTVNPASRM